MKRSGSGPANPVVVGMLTLVLGALIALTASPARAHGPTVVITEAGLKPALLNLFVGSTVHFTNQIAGAEGVVVGDEAGSFSSPPIAAAGEGWHYTFERIGEYAIRVVGRPGATMRIVVIAKPAA